MWKKLLQGGRASFQNTADIFAEWSSPGPSVFGSSPVDRRVRVELITANPGRTSTQSNPHPLEQNASTDGLTFMLSGRPRAWRFSRSRFRSPSTVSSREGLCCWGCCSGVSCWLLVYLQISVDWPFSCLRDSTNDCLSFKSVETGEQVYEFNFEMNWNIIKG